MFMVLFLQSRRQPFPIDKSIYCRIAAILNTTKVNFFSSVAHVWLPGAKTTGPIVKKFGFS
jgi:hypothetical protein